MNYDWFKDKIKSTAKATGIPAAILYRSFIMERFLDRVAKSQYKENFILKGGMLIASMVGFNNRMTMDIDATIQGSTVSVTEVRKMVEIIIQADVADGIVFVLEQVEVIHEAGEYPGIRVALTAKIDKLKQPFKIDITAGDVVTPRAIEYSYKSLFNEETINILAYNLETILAEKLETVLIRNIANTRLRDFYDIYMLCHIYGHQCDAKVFREAFKRTAKFRGSLNNINEFAEGWLLEIKSSNTLQQAWKNYARKNPYAQDLSFEDTLNSVSKLYKLLERKE